MLSSRGAKSAGLHNIPWRYAPQHTYDKETNPSGIISFGNAEHRPMRTDIANFINKKVVFTEDSVGYRPPPSRAARLSTALTAHLDRILSPNEPINRDHVVIASNATALGGMLGYILAEPGDGILVSRPVYGRFELDYGVEAGVKMVYTDNGPEEAFSPTIVAKYEMALRAAEREGTKIRAVLIVNPNNPVGRCYPAETLKEILKFCSRHQLHLISDEVYASCVFDTGDPEVVPFTSILSLDIPSLIDPNLVHFLYGFSKDFASGGLRLGFLITPNAELRQACQAIMRLHGASTAAITIGIAILEDQQFVSDFTAKSCQSLASKYRITTSTLKREGIQYVKGGNAGFFIYMDLSPFLPNDDTLQSHEREFALAQKLLDAGVFLHPGEEHAKKPGWFRLVFSQEEEVLQEGLRRMLSVLKPSN